MITGDPAVDNAVAELERKDISVFPHNFRVDHKPIKDKPGEFREVHWVDLIKRGSGEKTPRPISEVKQDEVVWRFVKPYYEAWLEGQEEPTDGTPIDAVPFIPPSIVPHLKNLHIKTVEDLASLNDADMERVGMGAPGWRNKARTYLESVKDNAAVIEAKQALTEANAALQKEIEELKQQVNQLVAQSGSKQAKPLRQANTKE